MSLGINSSVPATMVSSYFDAPCIMLDVMSDNLQALSMVMTESSTIVVCSGIDYNNLFQSLYNAWSKCGDTEWLDNVTFVALHTKEDGEFSVDISGCTISTGVTDIQYPWQTWWK